MRLFWKIIILAALAAFQLGIASGFNWGLNLFLVFLIFGAFIFSAKEMAIPAFILGIFGEAFSVFSFGVFLASLLFSVFSAAFILNKFLSKNRFESLILAIILSVFIFTAAYSFLGSWIFGFDYTAAIVRIKILIVPSLVSNAILAILLFFWSRNFLRRKAAIIPSGH